MSRLESCETAHELAEDFTLVVKPLAELAQAFHFILNTLVSRLGPPYEGVTGARRMKARMGLPVESLAGTGRMKAWPGPAALRARLGPLAQKSGWGPLHESLVRAGCMKTTQLGPAV